jgi:hypothetical protein
MGIVGVWPCALLAVDITTIAALLISLIAAIGGLGVGGLIGARMTAKTEFEQQLRERMLGAADDFIAASAAGLSQLRALDPTARSHPLPRWSRVILGNEPAGPAYVASELTADVARQVQASVDEATRQLNRVVLIFSPLSGATTEAERAVTKMSEAWAALQWFYALSVASESESVKERRDAIVGAFQTLGAVGFAAASAVVPGLVPGSKTGSMLGELIGGAVANTDNLLDEASNGAAGAITEASDALTQFAAIAGAQALVSSRPSYKVTYRVESDEQVVSLIEPQRERPALTSEQPVP